MSVEIYPHWYQRKPVSVDHREAEGRVQARHRLYIILQRAQQENPHSLYQSIEHIYHEVEDSENIIISPLIIEANPELKGLLDAAGFVLIEEMPALEQRRLENVEYNRERILKGSNMNKKEH